MPFRQNYMSDHRHLFPISLPLKFRFGSFGVKPRSVSLCRDSVAPPASGTAGSDPLFSLCIPRTSGRAIASSVLVGWKCQLNMWAIVAFLDDQTSMTSAFQTYFVWPLACEQDPRRKGLIPIHVSAHLNRH